MQCVYELTQRGANLDATNNSGETALLSMIRRSNFDCVIGLLAKGATATLKGCNGDNAVHLAVEVICFICIIWVPAAVESAHFISLPDDVKGI